jgi:hypothetical protein
VNKSNYYNLIPLPAVLDNRLEELIHKHRYRENDIPESALPSFDPPNELVAELDKLTITKKIEKKLKNLKRRQQRKLQ